MRRALLIAALLVLVAPAPAHAGALIDRAVEGLQSDNVYVDPDADPTLTAAQADALRDRIVSERADPMYVVVAPRAIVNEAGGSAAGALREIGNTLDQRGTYVIVAGRNIRALASADVMPTGEAGKLATEAIEAEAPDLDAILLDLTDRVGAERNGGGDDGGGVPVGAIVLVGAGAVGGGALLLSRRRRRAREAEEFEDARRNARDDLVALGDDIRALDLDVELPDTDPDVRSDYEHAVQRYTEADERWRVAQRPGELAPVGEALEEGRWAMASAKARMDGEEPPERRPPCFFDPRHGPSTRDVLWSPPYGQPREVPACEADALRVEQGDEPAPREIEWGGRHVPYWQAGAAYAPYAGGYFGGFGGGLLPGILIGSTLGATPDLSYGDSSGGGDFGGGDFGGGMGGDFGGGGDFG
ncbi:MAG: hypothetical protein ACAH82_04335, partial [Solirubrobacteraceae bacterium]